MVLNVPIPHYSLFDIGKNVQADVRVATLLGRFILIIMYMFNVYIQTHTHTHTCSYMYMYICLVPMAIPINYSFFS